MNDNKSIVFSPSSFNFGNVLASTRPIYKTINIINSYDFCIAGFFKIDGSDFYIRKADDNFLLQAHTGFDIFLANFPKETIIIKPKSQISVSGILYPGKNPTKIEKSLSFIYLHLSSSLDFSEITDSELDPNDFDESDLSSCIINLQANVLNPEFEITPQIAFLDDCCKGKQSTVEFSVKNLSSIDFPLLIHIPSDIMIESYKENSFFTLSPHMSITFKAVYFPAETGQFSRIIDIQYANCSSIHKSFRLMTSVSPAMTPNGFPVFSPQKLDFGNVFAGHQQESFFSVSNNSNDDYTINICSFSEIGNSHPLKFKSALRSEAESEVHISLPSQTSRSIYVYYTPSVSSNSNPSTFEKRVFVATLKFNLLRNDSVFYRRVPCQVSVCHSSISLSPSVINFGEIQVSGQRRHGRIMISNISPLATWVKVTCSTRWIAFSSSRIELPPNKTVPFDFTFFAYKTMPDFISHLKFINEASVNNQEEVTIKASIMPSLDEISHNSYYSLIYDRNQSSIIDFGFVAANFPSLKFLAIKNVSKSPISLLIHSTSKKEIGVFLDNSDYSSPLMKSVSQSGILPNSNPDYPSFSIPSEKVNIFILEKLMRDNSSFFNNRYQFNIENNEKQIVEFFQWQYDQFRLLISTGSITSALDEKLTIAPGSKLHLFVSVTSMPSDTLIWRARKEQLEFCLVDTEDNIPPQKIPLIFNVGLSTSFISAHNLNYGEMVRKTIKESSILLSNESPIPLIYKMQCEKASECVSFVRNSFGIIDPLSSQNVVIRFETPHEGSVNEQILVYNLLNPLDTQYIHFKANVHRRANFFIDPIDIDFGEVQFGSSITTLFNIKNIGEDSAQFELSHIPKDNPFCKPIIAFQYKQLSEQHLSEATELQIEKQNRKLLILVRKNKTEAADKIRTIIDQLKKHSEQNDMNMAFKSHPKYIDHCSFNSGPLQSHFYQIQFIPSIKSNISVMKPFKVDGIINVFENNRQDTIKSVRYKAVIKPKVSHTYEPAEESSITLTPSFIDFGGVFIHSCASNTIMLTNNSKTNVQNFWLSSNSSNDAILSCNVDEGQIEPGATIPISFDVFPLDVGKMSKLITITTPTSSQSCEIRFDSLYQQVLSFPSFPIGKSFIDFEMISLSSFHTIEHRRSFDITNVSSKTLYVSIANIEKSHITIYEQDPSAPFARPIPLCEAETLRINIRLKPDIDQDCYRKYTTLSINDTIIIRAFENPEDASNAKPNIHDASCIFRTEIPVKAYVGRIGLSSSEKLIDFGSIAQGIYSHTLMIKNRSSLIPLDVFCNCSQGLSVDQTHFILPGHKESKNPHELSVSFSPSIIGLNSGRIVLSTTITTSFQLSIDVIAFIDPKIITINLPKNDKNYYLLNAGFIYFNSEKVFNLSIPVNLKNNTSASILGEIPELSSNFIIKPYGSTEVIIRLPVNDYIPQEEKDFSTRLTVRNRTTNNIIQIIDLLAQFVNSNSSLSTNTIDFGKVINSEMNSELIQTFIVTNNSKGDLYLDLIKDSHIFIVPKVIGPIKSNSSIEIPVHPDVEHLKTQFGNISGNLMYMNRYNSSNSLSINAQISILPAFLQFEGLIHRDNMFLLEFSSFSEVVREDRTELSSTIRFKATNIFEDEIVTEIEISEFIQNEIHFELKHSNSSQTLENMIIQPSESIEFRCKIVLIDQDSTLLLSQQPIKIASMTIKSIGYPKIPIVIFFIPNFK